MMQEFSEVDLLVSESPGYVFDAKSIPNYVFFVGILKIPTPSSVLFWVFGSRMLLARKKYQGGSWNQNVVKEFEV